MRNWKSLTTFSLHCNTAYIPIVTRRCTVFCAFIFIDSELQGRKAFSLASKAVIPLCYCWIQLKIGALVQKQLGFINRWWCEFAATGGVFYLQQCRNPHSNRSHQKWVIPHFSWMANKERPEARLFLASNHAYARCTDKDAGEIEQLKVCCLQGQLANTACLSRSHVCLRDCGHAWSHTYLALEE